MISRSDWEPLPTPTLSPFLHPGTFLCVGFHCRCVVCACSAGAVGSFSNKPLSPKLCQYGASETSKGAPTAEDGLAFNLLLDVEKRKRQRVRERERELVSRS